MTDLKPGDVIAVRTPDIFGRIIRWSEHLRGLDDKTNHIAGIHHYTNGIPWALEGRPGGVGWVDARDYLADQWTVTNADQPKDDAGRVQIARDAEAMLRCGYDWEGIFGDACRDLHLPELWALDWHGQGPPGHVVCSSYWAWLYDRRGWARPDPKLNGRWVEPGDWAGWMRAQGWAGQVAA